MPKGQVHYVEQIQVNKTRRENETEVWWMYLRRTTSKDQTGRDCCQVIAINDLANHFSTQNE